MLSFLQSLFVYLCVQSIEKAYCINDDCNSEDILWDKKILPDSVICKYKRYE